jgi:hypothetical protein
MISVNGHKVWTTCMTYDRLNINTPSIHIGSLNQYNIFLTFSFKDIFVT